MIPPRPSPYWGRAVEGVWTVALCNAREWTRIGVWADMLAAVAANVNDVIRTLDRLESDEATLMLDPDLNRMLDQFRATAPLPYRCSRDRCRTPIAYWAVASHGARILPGPKRRSPKQRIAGEYSAAPHRFPLADRASDTTTLVGGAADLRFPDLRHEGRFEEAVEWALLPESAISVEANPGVRTPWPLRWSFTCPNCNASYRHTNRQMLRMFLTAIRLQQRSIRPGHFD